MSFNKFISLNSGRDTLTTAIASSAGVADANKIPQTGSDGRLDVSLMPTGIGPEILVLPSSENLAVGDYVNIWNDSGTVKARKADSTNDRPAQGFTKAAVTAPANVTIYYEGANDNFSGLTKGGRVYLSASGGVQQTAPAYPTDVIHQYLGLAVSATEVSTEIDDEIVLS